jgi:hypothetical protein
MQVGSVVAGTLLAFVAGSLFVVGPPAMAGPTDPYDALARFGAAIHNLVD